jgi:hypothetical protein
MVWIKAESDIFYINTDHITYFTIERMGIDYWVKAKKVVSYPNFDNDFLEYWNICSFESQEKAEDFLDKILLK